MENTKKQGTDRTEGPSKPVLVAGGGVGGLTLALALQKRGIAVKVFEKTNVLRPVGAGLTLWSNANRVLARLGLMDAIKSCSKDVSSAIVGHWKGGILATTDLETFVKKHRLDPAIGIHRAALHDVLLSALAPGTVELGAHCTSVVTEAGGATLLFDGRDEHNGHVVVGADGLHSAIRRSILGEEALRYSGYTAWRGIAEVEDIENYAHGEVWGPGRRFGIVPIKPRVIYWFCTETRQAHQLLPAEDRKAYLLQAFAGWGHGIPRLLNETPQGSILQNDIHDHPPRVGWSSGRATLLGDAAHPTTPNLGQGACQAIESAYILAECLASLPDPADAFALYERLRQPRTAWITTTSWRVGSLGQWKNPLARSIRDLFVRLTPPSFTLSTFARAAGYDPLSAVSNALPQPPAPSPKP